MSVLGKHRFTTLEYHRMAETGVLKPNARVELLDGQIVDMTPIGPFHGGSVNRLNRFFTGLAGGRWLVSVQNPVLLDEYSEPQPDLMLLKPSPDDYTSRHPRPEDVLLLIEVADTSLGYDRGEKLSAYGRAGIREVWIINLSERSIEVCREPHYAGYGSMTVLRPGDQARPLLFPDVVVVVAGLFGLGK
jgi:Uma2 family endonuclease